ncbi:hypothetical protein OAZ95_00515 [Gammaproteobacteria bacterium]|nr:hypothetical protein [Gammaproteobacteria bacterium]
MKKIFFIFLIFSHFNIFSETYFCSHELSKYGRPGEVETMIFERNGNFFNYQYQGNKELSLFQTISETDSSLILLDVMGDSLTLVFLNKKTLEFAYDFTSLEQIRNNRGGDHGTCELFN